MIVILLLGVFLPIFLSAIFSATETAFTASSLAKLYKWKNDGNKRADQVINLKLKNDLVIGTILLANNSVNILASSITTWVSMKFFGDEGVLYATIFITIMIIIFAEVLPKTFAIVHSDKFILFIGPFLNILVIILSPITSLVQKIVTFLLKIFGADKNLSNASTDELRGAIDLHHKEGVVKKDDRDMLDGILNLSEVEVGKIMTHRKKIYSVNCNESNENVLNKILDSGHTRVPVYQGDPDNIVGIIHTKDLLKSQKLNKEDTKTFNLLDFASKPWFVPETTKLHDQLKEFKRRKKHFAIVVDEYGVMQGIITLYDILEEIVGLIDDEYQSKNMIQIINANNCIIDGGVTVKDLNRALEWNVPDLEAATVAGLIIHKTEKIPEEGEEFRFYNLVFKIIKKQYNQITEISIRKE